MVAALAWSGSGAAAGPPPPPVLPGLPAVDQYREAVPTGLGPVAPGTKGRRARPLPRPARAALAQAPPSVQVELRRVATSPAYGAPPAPPRTKRELAPASPTTPAVPAAEASGSYLPLERLTGLGAVLLALTGATAVAARRQRRIA